jgi:hypothetical protein
MQVIVYVRSIVFCVSVCVYDVESLVGIKVCMENRCGTFTFVP